MTIPFDHWIVATDDGREDTTAALVVHDRAVIISGGLIIDTMKSVANAKQAAAAVNATIDCDAAELRAVGDGALAAKRVLAFLADPDASERQKARVLDAYVKRRIAATLPASPAPLIDREQLAAACEVEDLGRGYAARSKRFYRRQADAIADAYERAP